MDNIPNHPDGSAFRWHPTSEQKEQSNLRAFLDQIGLESYQQLLGFSSSHPDRFWEEVITFSDIRFYKEYDRICDTSAGIEHARWCVGGKTNIVLNCVDKHVAEGRGDMLALTWVAEMGQTRDWTYAELDREVCRIAASLVRLGCKPGDVVALYLPVVPESIAIFLAIAKIGGIVLPLFSGFGAGSIATRVNAAGARFLISADGTKRRGKTIPMNTVMDEAVQSMPGVERVIMLDVVGIACERNSRYLRWDDFIRDAPTHFPTVEVDAEAPLLIMYTSGTTGLPKGAVHTHCGFIAKMALDYIIFNDVKATDRFLWMSDLGWFVVPAQIVSTCLAGGTLVLAEGVPDYPAPNRLLQLVADHRVSVFGLSPTIARMLRANTTADTPHPDLAALRIIISGGEPWDVPTWEWVMDYVCDGVVPILNHCGGTEVGALIVSSILDPMNPGGFSGPSPGTGADIVDNGGNSLPQGEVGELVMRHASMGTTRGLWREPERYIEQYWSRMPGLWVQGDLVSIDDTGLWFVHGRSDDTLKISGKRTGPAEIETALIAAGEVAEAAAVGVPDAIKGTALVCVVVLRQDAVREGIEARLQQAVVKKLGSSYLPKEVIVVDELPKNRTNKLLRRLVRSALTGESPGDLSSVVNPEVVEHIRIRSGRLATC